MTMMTLTSNKMKNKILVLFLLLASSVFAATYKLEEKAFTIGTDLEIGGGNGTIEQRVMSIGKHFEIVGPYACESQERILSIGTTYEIIGNGRLLAVVHKDIVESMFTFMGNVFVIKDAGGKEIARSELFRGLWPTITIKESNGAVTVMSASGLLYHTWTIKQPSNSKLDPRILFIICASKTAKDNEK